MTFLVRGSIILLRRFSAAEGGFIPIDDIPKDPDTEACLHQLLQAGFITDVQSEADARTERDEFISVLWFFTNTLGYRITHDGRLYLMKLDEESAKEAPRQKLNLLTFIAAHAPNWLSLILQWLLSRK